MPAEQGREDQAYMPSTEAGPNHISGYDAQITEDQSSRRLEDPGPSRRRARASEGRMAYPRKRAITACQLCRMRKTKCDNLRPACGGCTSLNSQCFYQDPGSDHSSFDQASLVIIERLNYVVQLLETQSQHLAFHQFSVSPTSPPSTNTTQHASDGAAFTGLATVRDQSSIVSITSPHVTFDDNTTALHDALDVSASCSADAILRWPIFSSAVDPDSMSASFFDPESFQTSRTSSSNEPGSFPSIRSRDTRGIQEADVPKLIQDFLHNVHTKNPILDSGSLSLNARKIAEDGFKWDGNSCLVLIACALANLSRPFQKSTPGALEKSYPDARDYPMAEAYYTAARKRVGLLDVTVLATQCEFLIGVYEMYSLRPFKAWMSFSHACTSFQAYLRSRPRQAAGDRSSKRLEQRLYWSCLKSECEMREEIDLPPTGLAKVDYPDIFPSPQGESPQPGPMDETPSSSVSEQIYERSWYYYLSEIACRRITNRIIHSLYNKGPESWTSSNLKRLIRIAEELDAQVVQWWEHMPEFVVEDLASSPDELSYMLQSRYLDMRERIVRPFLYIVVHEPTSHDEFPKLRSFARQCIQLTLKDIDHMAIRHRHHGTWYSVRQGFAKGLLVLAVVKSGNMDLLTPDWTRSVGLVRTCFTYWEDEAPDLHVGRLVFDHIYADVTKGD